MNTRQNSTTVFAVLIFIGTTLAWVAAGETNTHAALPGAGGDPSPVLARKKVDVSKVFGKIQFVDSFPDYRVKVVKSFADLKVKKVVAFPNGPGKWQIVDSHPNYKIKIVESFPDFTVKYVESLPGFP